ncbi:transposase, partial [Comamonas aquatica]
MDKAKNSTFEGQPQVVETCRKHGISEPTYYKWKSQFAGMTVSHLSQLRQL